MIDELREFLVDRDVDCMQITRLEFRSDLKRGDKKRIWQAFGTMMSARKRQEGEVQENMKNITILHYKL